MLCDLKGLFVSTGVKFRQAPENMYWWSDVQFVPNKDNELMNSVGAFVHRPGRIPLVANHLVHGLLYTMHLEDQLSECIQNCFVRLMRGGFVKI